MIESKITSNISEFVDYFKTVPKEINEEVFDEIPKIQKKTKDIVKNSLTKGHGVDQGVYRKSIVIRDLSEKNTYQIHFQVGGNKKHYRLTHLLENGHHIVVHGLGKIGKMTREIPHIEPGQDYADKAVENLYVTAINKALERKIK